MISAVIPVFNNSDSIQELFVRLLRLRKKFGKLEAVFVIDGSPDDSALQIETGFNSTGLVGKMVFHSRNLGSFQAIRTGIANASGDVLIVMSADLQEPETLFEEMLQSLISNECDVAIGSRTGRSDGFLNDLASGLYWRGYAKFVNREIPIGGVDVFGCSKPFAKNLIELRETRTSLIGQLFWLGFRRKEFLYKRQPRLDGQKSGWSLRRKLSYLDDSIFSFTNAPVRFLAIFGMLWLGAAFLFALFVVLERFSGAIQEPGYTTIILLLLLTNSLNLIGLGVVGAYAWRGYENSKQRPNSLIWKVAEFN